MVKQIEKAEIEQWVHESSTHSLDDENSNFHNIKNKMKAISKAEADAQDVTIDEDGFNIRLRQADRSAVLYDSIIKTFGSNTSNYVSVKPGRVDLPFTQV